MGQITAGAGTRAAACVLLALLCAARTAGGSHAQPSLEGIPIDGRTRSLLVGIATGRSLAEATQPALGIANSASYPGIVAAATLTTCGDKYQVALSIPAANAGLYRARVKARGVAVAPPTDSTPSVAAGAGESCGRRAGRGSKQAARNCAAAPSPNTGPPSAPMPSAAAAPSAAPVVVGKPGAAAVAAAGLPGWEPAPRHLPLPCWGRPPNLPTPPCPALQALRLASPTQSAPARLWSAGRWAAGRGGHCSSRATGWPGGRGDGRLNPSIGSPS